MGYSTSWLAIKGRAKSDVQREFGLSESGKTEELPQSAIPGTDLPDGSYLVFLNECFHRFSASEAVLARLSQGCEPAALNEIKARLLKQQEEEQPVPSSVGVDYIIDIPLELAASFCGYRHDTRAEWGEPAFTILAENKAKRRRDPGQNAQ